MPSATKHKSTKKAKPAMRFDQRLALNQWMLSLFHTESFEPLVQHIKSCPELEGFTEDNQTRFYHELTNMLWQSEHLPNDVLLQYDENIVRHWKQITAHRNAAGHNLYPKYFQYFAMLFAEIYLDRYFNNKAQLLDDLNHHAEKFNQDKPAADQITPYQNDDLSKIAFWQATGSGKTLIMHVNILQYQHYLRSKHKQHELNRILLLTPNEGLSKQHLEEFELSGMKAELFQKEQRPLFATQDKLIEIIDINKLRETEGEKTVAVEAFEGNNLVLVDEGHRGSSGIEWKNRRDQLCEGGFSMEYSATFGQAMKAANKKELTQEYAKCILFDYSYKYFYKDGYGKDYSIYNYNEERKRHDYLLAALLSFYQQKKAYNDKKMELIPFLVDTPLWVFVGGSVTKSVGTKEVSDVVDILQFLSRFVRQQDESKAFFKKIIQGGSGILDQSNRDIFQKAFRYVQKIHANEDELFTDVLKVVFNTPVTGKLHIENLKGADGEIALKIGDADEFGLINVGDAAKLCKECEKHPEFVVVERAFSGSLFHQINDPASKINVLIGSRKFTEGWNSWRVSSMGLMNIGKSEGSMIIQLFGRGVRLRGYEFCLKRSKYAPVMQKPEQIEILETLNIFGIKADYMQQFKEFLEEEGLPTNEDRIEYTLPVIKNLNGKKLKVPRVKDGYDFKKDETVEKPALQYLNDGKIHITLNWYPKVQAKTSLAGRTPVLTQLHEGKIETRHTAFMDREAIYFELQKFKNERSWYNLNLNRMDIDDLINRQDWYMLFIPEDELALTKYSKVYDWQEILIALLKKYCEKYYYFKKSEYELPKMEYIYLTEDDKNFIPEYTLLIAQDIQEIVNTLDLIKEAVKKHELIEFTYKTIFKSVMFSQHLYQPLIYFSKDNQELLQIKPVSLNESEKQFVDDLKVYYEKSKDDFFKDKELYLLRNRSRGKGIGFFEAGNFYPDFILWLLVEDKQYISFVDPHGLRMTKAFDDPKLKFHSKIKELENCLGDPNVIMNSFIVTPTEYIQIKFWGYSQTELEDKNVLFQKVEKDRYIHQLMTKSLKR